MAANCQGGWGEAERAESEKTLKKVLDTFIVMKTCPVDELNLQFLSEKPQLMDKVKEYLRWDRNPTTRKVVQDMVASENVDAMTKLLENRLEFGTAGLRGKMAAGFNAMNDIVIIQTTQGFVSYLETLFTKEELSTKGVVVGYDGRHNSNRFAILTANAFMSKGYQVYLFSRLCPTPWVPFAVTLFKCCAGIMVTASHNPKEDNGYKVYWQNGAQIIPPHDKGIQRCILKNLEPWEGAWEVDSTKASKILKDPLPEVMKHYYYTTLNKGIGHDAQRNADCTVKFAYTAMHGVGFLPMQEAFKLAKFPMENFIPVEEQMNPDPEFPTVKFPNPEEGKSALNLSIQTANKNHCTVILANDPDADRLAVAEKLPNGEWKIFNGNEIGALLGWWCFLNWSKDNEKSTLKNCYMISSTVSSKILKTIADKEGFNFRETLTGFKWMANLADELGVSGKTVLFAFEEAIGFMVGTAVLDKDGISAGIRVAEMAAELKLKGLTLNNQLIKIYETYGYHISRNSYYLCYDPATINSLFENIRTLSNGNYPNQLLNGKYKINRVRDLTTGLDSGEPDNKATLPVSKGSQMLSFYFENGLVVTLRTSGTEPKIKYYTELCAAPTERDWSAVKGTLDEMLGAIIKEWVQPEKWGLSLSPDVEAEEEREMRSA